MQHLQNYKHQAEHVKGQMGHVSTSFCVSKDNFDQFWEQTLKESKELGIEDPKLKRKEKIPKK